MPSTLIVALDFANSKDAMALVDALHPKLCALKVGSELFTIAGPDFVSCLVNKGYRVFLDLKFHDIPNTVAQACLAAARLGVWMLTLHIAGGPKMMGAAVRALETVTKRPLLMGVTVLTSMDDEQLQCVGIAQTLEQQVMHLAALAKNIGLDGVVCAATEVPAIKSLCGQSLLALTPGIRLLGEERDDQSRVVTPEQAIKLGSDFLVLGRSVIRSSAPAALLASIQAKIPNP